MFSWTLFSNWIKKTIQTWSLSWPQCRKVAFYVPKPVMLWCLLGMQQNHEHTAYWCLPLVQNLADCFLNITAVVLERSYCKLRYFFWDRWKAKYFLCCWFGCAHEYPWVVLNIITVRGTLLLNALLEAPCVFINFYSMKKTPCVQPSKRQIMTSSIPNIHTLMVFTALMWIQTLKGK